MKSPFIILYLSFLIAAISSCKSQQTSNYAGELQGCLGPSDIELLNTLSNKFENHIKQTYKVPATQSYKKYLQSVATGSFPQDFFRYSTFESDMNRFRNSEFYKRSWVKTSNFNEEAIIEVPPTVIDGEVQNQEVYDPIALDPTGNYVNCLTNKNNSKAINDYLEVIKAGIDISPGLVAQALYENLSEEELDGGLTRLIIAINFHYQIGLLITEEN